MSCLTFILWATWSHQTELIKKPQPASRLIHLCLIQVSKKYVAKDVSEKIHAKAKPFIDWLKTAEEDSSDEDEDDEVNFTILSYIQKCDRQFRCLSFNLRFRPKIVT